MLRSANLFKIGDLFLYSRVAFADSGDYKFRFLKWEQVQRDRAQFSAVLATIIRESMPYFENQGGPGTLAYFTIQRDAKGRWPKFEVEKIAERVEHCTKCAIPLEWASLAMKCPNCWTVF